MRVFQHLRRAIDLPRRHALAIHQLEDLARRPARGPAPDQFVEFLLVRAARLVAVVTRIGGEFCAAHRLAQAPEYRVLVRGDQHQAIPGRVDIGRRDIRQDRAGTLADVAGLVVFRDQRFHHAKHGLIDCRVNHLAAAGTLAVIEG
ncbi:MAG: hypothetical protein HW392_1031 [Steroidobacteraceae bacterium]|nr:hypothetical protein [Steroidobacteraceae bacterium]